MNTDLSKLQSTGNSPYPRQTPWLYFNISLFWFALSFLWAGMITIVIQKLVEDMAGPKKDLYLGWTLAVGALVSTIICIIAGTMSDRSRWRMGKRRPYRLPHKSALGAGGRLPGGVCTGCCLSDCRHADDPAYQEEGVVKK